jgi:2-phospho-L-lactate guanylyltransferase
VHSTRRADLTRTWAIVPIRGLESAKTRLGGDLDAEERVALVTDLLRRTLVATRDADRIEGTIVVTMDPDAAGEAKAHGAIGLVELAPGLNAAIVAARSLAVARGATAILVLPADLPAAAARYVDALVDTAARFDAPAGLVALVPDRHGAGTNVLVVSPPELVDPQFGDASRHAHAKVAERAGARFAELDSPLDLDVDTAADLLEAEAAIGGFRA